MYEKDNHLGNVLAVVSDRKIAVDLANDGTTDYFTAEVISANDYYAFGSPMPGRSFTSSNYRYGFNGKENDPETGTQDYGMRIYDTRIGKFLSVDPLGGKFPFYTPYQFAGNKPIACIDLDGLEDVYNLIIIQNKTGTTVLKAYNHFLAGSKRVGSESQNFYLLTRVKNGITIHQFVSRAIFHRAAENIGLGGYVGDGRNMFEYWTDEATIQLYKNNNTIKVKGNAAGGSSSDPFGASGFHGYTNPQVSTNDPEAEPSPGSSAESKELTPIGWDGKTNPINRIKYDNDGFFQLDDKSWRKDFENQNYMYKNKNGKDTTVVWSGKTLNYDKLTPEEKKEISTWKPLEKK